jgi:hypothetical protein
MKEYFLFMILPVLLPPIVGAFKGPTWGFGMVGIQLVVIAVSMLGLRLIGDPFSASAIFVSSIVALVLVSVQALAGRMLRPRRSDKGLGA